MPTPFPARPGDHRFFSFMAVFSAVTILAGFFNTYGPKVMTGQPPLPPIIHLHALVFTAWLAVFVAQTTLVLTGRTAVHRRLGLAAMALAPLLVIVGTATSIIVTRAGDRGIPGVEFDTPAGFLLLNLNALLIFAVCVWAGWVYRNNAQAHKRLMLLSLTGSMIGPGVSRLPFASGKPAVIALLAVSFLLAGPIYDLITRRRVHRVYWWGVPFGFLAAPPAVMALSATSAWQRIASLMIGS
jgi:hypothetical protein